MFEFEPSSVAAFRHTVRGAVIGPQDADYAFARRVYNAMIDRHPALIVRCADVADVQKSVRFGAEQDVVLAIRGGAHNAGGLSVADDGLVIDLSTMRGVRVDAEARTVRVDGGCTFHDVDAATYPFGMAVPSGVISTTGVGGLTLGGGTGHLTRRYGLTIDSLLAAEVVLADGRAVRASEDENADLFWALRGGGGNFGAVTAFEFRLQPGGDIIGGPTFFPLDRAREVMQWYREFILEQPDDLNGFFAFLTVPPAAPFPAELHGKPMCAVFWTWTGPATRADEMFAPVRALSPAFYGVGPMPLPAWNSAFDALYPSGLQWYWRADFVGELPDAAIDRNVEFGSQLPTPLATMHMYPSDGAAQRVDPHATAYSYREANWNQVICGVSPDPADREKITRWTKDYWNAVHPYSLGGAYVNFLMHDEGPSRVQATYRENYPRLVEVKRRYDPQNRFRSNQNIDPTQIGASSEAVAPR